jgi:hypothetical protein
MEVLPPIQRGWSGTFLTPRFMFPLSFKRLPVPSSAMSTKKSPLEFVVKTAPLLFVGHPRLGKAMMALLRMSRKIQDTRPVSLSAGDEVGLQPRAPEGGAPGVEDAHAVVIVRFVSLHDGRLDELVAGGRRERALSRSLTRKKRKVL